MERLCLPSVYYSIFLGTDLGVGEEELAALGEAQEDVAGLDGRHRHGVFQAERQPHRQPRELQNSRFRVIICTDYRSCGIRVKRSNVPISCEAPLSAAWAAAWSGPLRSILAV